MAAYVHYNCETDMLWKRTHHRLLVFSKQAAATMNKLHLFLLLVCHFLMLLHKAGPISAQLGLRRLLVIANSMSMCVSLLLCQLKRGLLCCADCVRTHLGLRTCFCFSFLLLVTEIGDANALHYAIE